MQTLETKQTTNGNAADLFVAAADDYHRRGLVPLPLRDGKNPGFTGWPDYTHSETVFRQKLFKATEIGVGVLMGPRSKLVDFEFDTASQCDKAIEVLGGLPTPGPQFTSRQGEHWIYRWDDRLIECGKAIVTFPCADGTKLKIRIGTGPNPAA